MTACREEHKTTFIAIQSIHIFILSYDYISPAEMVRSLRNDSLSYFSFTNWLAFRTNQIVFCMKNDSMNVLLTTNKHRHGMNVNQVVFFFF